MKHTHFYFISEYCTNSTLIVPRDDDDGAEVTSPFFPAYYPDNVDCFWSVTSDALTGYIVVSFVTLDLQYLDDFLVVGYGEETGLSSTAKARLSGANAPRTGTINGTALWLRFTTSNIGQVDIGFKLLLEWSDTYGKLSINITTLNSKLGPWYL